MNYLIIAITAYLLNAISVLIDKALLVKKLPNPALYVFYISLFSLLVLVLIPFTTFPGLPGFFISSISTVLWTLGAYYMFRGLKIGEAARVIPIIGTLIPVILLFMSFISGTVSQNEIWAAGVLIVGLIFLIFPYLKGKFSYEELGFEIASALLFANSYFLLKIAYETSSFLPIFVYSKLILVPVILIILILPFLRRKIFTNHSPDSPHKLFSKTGLIFFAGQSAGGASQLLLTFAISLASPAIVNSIQGIQYVFIFVLSLVLARKFPGIFNEKFTPLNLAGKIIGIILITVGLWILSIGTQTDTKPQLGVTFSARYARELGLNPDEVYQKILFDLKPEIIRLPLYWDEIEQSEGQFDFSKNEKLVKQAMDTNTKVILTLGFKQPRWPECFQPEWTKKLDDEEFDQQVMDLLVEEVNTFKKYPNITHWQLENEPFVLFGICPQPNPDRLISEIEIVKRLDDRPLLITDSGELSWWINAIKLSDVFGTTLYRKIWSPYFGSVSYPVPPVFYKFKADVAKLITGSNNKSILISELQAEPWPENGKAINQVSLDEQVQLFPKDQLLKNYQYAKETAMSPILFWGVEWWYYMQLNGISDYWIEAKNLFEEKNATGFYPISDLK